MQKPIFKKVIKNQKFDSKKLSVSQKNTFGYQKFIQKYNFIPGVWKKIHHNG